MDEISGNKSYASKIYCNFFRLLRMLSRHYSSDYHQNGWFTAIPEVSGNSIESLGSLSWWEDICHLTWCSGLSVVSGIRLLELNFDSSTSTSLLYAKYWASLHLSFFLCKMGRQNNNFIKFCEDWRIQVSHFQMLSDKWMLAFIAYD